MIHFVCWPPKTYISELFCKYLSSCCTTSNRVYDQVYITTLHDLLNRENIRKNLQSLNTFWTQSIFKNTLVAIVSLETFSWPQNGMKSVNFNYIGLVKSEFVICIVTIAWNDFVLIANWSKKTTFIIGMSNPQSTSGEGVRIPQWKVMI